MKNIIEIMKYRTSKRAIKALTFSMLLVATTLLVNSCETDETQTVTTLNNLVMADEFDVEGTPNPAMWGFDIGTGVNGWGNQELQYYTNRPENVRVENGFLLITAIEESFEGSSYTSGRILTKGLFETQYGRFEARMRLPYGKGFWPAFWLLGANIDEVGWPQCGEIDVMENAGARPTIVSSAVHGPGYNAGLAITKEYDFEDARIDNEFHVYGIEWSPNQINFYVDDDLYHTITPADVTGEWVFNNGEFFILINLAVGGVFDGPPNDETVFPQTMVVDYVRVYQ
ncbi:family 16 glycosylhydrolase [Winogradskyella sp. 3972H.M.0a.05]|uniref:glycoside hydrolase family 16 protein n=1 Tax=Winogradskyella sp. 3972H.M.0a.05 TaxID=2950277 RepID=UPI0033914E89